MSVIIQLKGGTAAKWQEVNPTLAEREMGIETDTHNYKIGDGFTSWNSLEYSSFPQNAEDGGNKVTIFDNPTDIQYPSAKLVYDQLEVNKTYSPETYSGMGRVILRKNMVGGVNILTQLMVNQANTIYEIRYDFDLNGIEITIPEGCVLKFEGGSIINGKIIGNNTLIIHNYPPFNSIELNGIFLTNNDIVSDNSLFIDSILSYSRIRSTLNVLCPSNKYLFTKGTYNEVETIQVTHNMNIDFCDSIINLKLDSDGLQYPFFIMPFNARGSGLQLDFVEIKNVTIIGNTNFEFQEEFYRGSNRNLICLFNVKNIKLENIQLSHINRGRTGSYHESLSERYELSPVSLFYYDSVKIKNIITNFVNGDNIIYCVPNIVDNNMTVVSDCKHEYIEERILTGLILVLNGKVDIHDNVFDGTKSSALNLYGVYDSKIYNNVFKRTNFDTSDGDCIDVFGDGSYWGENIEIFNNVGEQVKTFCIAHGRNIHIHDNLIKESYQCITIFEQKQDIALIINFNRIPTDIENSDIYIIGNEFNSDSNCIYTSVDSANRIPYRHVVISHNILHGSECPIARIRCKTLRITDNTLNQAKGYGTSKMLCIQLIDSSPFENIEIKNNLFEINNTDSEKYIILYGNTYPEIEPVNFLITGNRATLLNEVDIRGINNICAYNNYNLDKLSVNMDSALGSNNRILIQGQMSFKNEKPIWWTGSNWVDATGATV